MEQIRSVFQEIVDKSGLDPTRLQMARLQEEWDEIAGEQLAQHLTVESLRNGELILRASDPSWSHEASMIREGLRKEINQHLETQLISSIRILS